MARSCKKGISYFSVDVDIFADRKLRRVRHIHSAGAMAVVLRALCCVYGENGYYAQADADFYFDIAEELSLDEAFVRAVIQSCAETGFFDAGLFDSCGVLTSRRIQRNYLDATRKRANAKMDQSLCLVGEGITAEETAFPAEDSVQNGVSGVQSTQSKVKEIKEKERRVKESATGEAAVPDKAAGMALLADCFRSVLEQDTHSSPSSSQPFIKPSVDDVKAYCAERGNSVDARRFVDFYESKGWMVGNSPMRDWQATVRVWEKNESYAAPPRPAYERPTENYDHLALDFFSDSG
jgi:hypothetical protein